MRRSWSRTSAATDIEIHRFDRAAIEGGGHEWRFPLAGGEVALTLPFTARHMAENTLAALVAYEALGLPLDRAQAGADCDHALPLAWRGAAARRAAGSSINDAYNANPTSMRAALLDLVGTRREPAPRGDPGRDGRARRRVTRATTTRSAGSSTSSGSSS